MTPPPLRYTPLRSHHHHDLRRRRRRRRHFRRRKVRDSSAGLTFSDLRHHIAVRRWGLTGNDGLELDYRRCPGHTLGARACGVVAHDRSSARCPSLRHTQRHHGRAMDAKPEGEHSFPPPQRLKPSQTHILATNHRDNP